MHDRCKNETKSLLCRKHLWQPFAAAIALLGAVTAFTYYGFGIHIWSDVFHFLHSENAVQNIPNIKTTAITEDIIRFQSPLPFTEEDALSTINTMIASKPPGISKFKIFSITRPVKSLLAVSIEPPYREFPNVILFRYDTADKNWQRVFEGLTLGIQFEPSTVLDLHTLGAAVDIAQPKHGIEQKLMVDFPYRKGWIGVPYEKFIHYHLAGRESYYLDKREFVRFFHELKLTEQVEFTDIECILFDLPKPLSLSLSYESGIFILQERTNNGQLWTVTFTGIEDNGLLSNKFISVELVNLKPTSPATN